MLMKDKDKTIEERMQTFARHCRQSGIKLTHQRLEIYREVVRSPEHPAVETVFRGVRERMPTVSLDTVYRTLRMFEGRGLIRTIGHTRDRARYDANMEQHHHFVCRSCGSLRDFYETTYDHLEAPGAIRDFGSIETTHVELRGLCHDCAERAGDIDVTQTRGTP